MAQLTLAARSWVLLGVGLILAIAVGCQEEPSPKEVFFEIPREEPRLLTATPRTIATSNVLSPTRPGPNPTLAPDGEALALQAAALSPASTLGSPIQRSRLVDWRMVNASVGVGDLELTVNAIQYGNDSYGGLYGLMIEAAPGTKIIFADLTLRRAFRAGQAASEVRTDYFAIADAAGAEHRGMPVPAMTTSLVERFSLAPGQAHRGVVAFIVPSDLTSGRLDFTDLGAGKRPPDRLSISLEDIPSPPLTARLRTILDERFMDNRVGWPNDPGSIAWFTEGGYYFWAKSPNRFIAMGVPLPEPLYDVVVNATFRKVGGPPGGGYGLIVRDEGPAPRDGINQGGRYYVLEAGEGKQAGVWRRNGDRWVDLLPWTPSEVVRPGGAANELTVVAIGHQLTFLVNGVEVTRQTATLRGGGMGVFVGGDGNEVILERLTIQALQ